MPHGRNWVMGEQLAQVDNRDPFAVPVWRSPVYRTPEPVIMVVQLIRLVWRVLWFALTHPLADGAGRCCVVAVEYRASCSSPVFEASANGGPDADTKCGPHEVVFAESVLLPLPLVFI